MSLTPSSMEPGRIGCGDLVSDMRYQIVVGGELAPLWSTWFEGLIITHDQQGNTVLEGTLADQAALHGILIKVRDLNLTLIAVKRVESRGRILGPHDFY